MSSDEAKMSGDQLWDPGQEWIQIFDNLLKHPQECKLFLMLFRAELEL